MFRSQDGKRLSVEASEIGLPLGTWPKEIDVLGLTYIKSHVEKDREGEITIVTYLRKFPTREGTSDLLDVIND